MTNTKPTNLKGLEDSQLEKINYLLLLREQLDFIWKFHPQNPWKQSIEQYHTHLVNELNKVNNEID